MQTPLFKTDLSQYDNSWYNPGRGKFVRMLWYLMNVLFLINPFNPSSTIKIILLKLFGAKIGNNVRIKPGVNIKYPWFLTVENNVWIGENVWIDNLTDVKIGNNVCISQGGMLLTGNHNYKKSTFDLMIGPIILEDGVWIGAKSIICQNVICRSHSILGINSFTSKELQAHCIYQGNPAVYVRKRNIEH